jgi:hypothetical protein
VRSRLRRPPSCFGWPLEVRREAEREQFVRTWPDPAHLAAVDDRFALEA